MMNATEMRDLTEEVLERRNETIRQQSIDFCETEIQKDIKLNAENGFSSVPSFNIPARYNINTIISHLIENGYKITQLTTFTISIKW